MSVFVTSLYSSPEMYTTELWVRCLPLVKFSALFPKHSHILEDSGGRK